MNYVKMYLCKLIKRVNSMSQIITRNLPAVAFWAAVAIVALNLLGD